MQSMPRLESGQSAGCARCGCLQFTRQTDGDQLPTTLTLAATIAITIVIAGAIDMWQDGQSVSAAVVGPCEVATAYRWALAAMATNIAIAIRAQ